jgi:hypothetical protein
MLAEQSFVEVEVYRSLCDAGDSIILLNVFEYPLMAEKSRSLQELIHLAIPTYILTRYLHVLLYIIALIFFKSHL